MHSNTGGIFENGFKTEGFSCRCHKGKSFRGSGKDIGKIGVYIFMYVFFKNCVNLSSRKLGVVILVRKKVWEETVRKGIDIIMC